MDLPAPHWPEQHGAMLGHATRPLSPLTSASVGQPVTKAHVTVHLKPGISDPEGQNTAKALHLLGFDAVRDVHTTRIWEIDLGDTPAEQAREDVDRMCRRLLTNPVIHDYTVAVE